VLIVTNLALFNLEISLKLTISPYIFRTSSLQNVVYVGRLKWHKKTLLHNELLTIRANENRNWKN